MERRNESGLAERAGSPGASTAPMVLVIEDDPDICATLTDVLGDEGYRVHVMHTALGALGEIERLHPAAILLDLALPYRSGAAVLMDLKTDPATASIPVIVVSAYLDTLSPERAALATTLLGKPFEVPDLLAAVQGASEPPRAA
jgi:CheY-like chemotaxis protein